MGPGSPASYVRMCVPDAGMCGQGANCCDGPLCNSPSGTSSTAASPGGESGDDVEASKLQFNNSVDYPKITSQSKSKKHSKCKVR